MGSAQQGLRLRQPRELRPAPPQPPVATPVAAPAAAPSTEVAPGLDHLDSCLIPSHPRRAAWQMPQRQHEARWAKAPLALPASARQQRLAAVRYAQSSSPRALMPSLMVPPLHAMPLTQAPAGPPKPVQLPDLAVCQGHSWSPAGALLPCPVALPPRMAHLTEVPAGLPKPVQHPDLAVFCSCCQMQ